MSIKEVIREELTKIVEDFDPEAVAIANKTYRRHGAVGGKAIVPRLVRDHVRPEEGKTILDFGSGTHAPHAMSLREEGYDVTAYDFGSNVGEALDPNALSRQYDVVYASNVINVQSSEDMLRRTLGQIRDAIKPGGIGIFNYPNAPRKGDIPSPRMIEIVMEEFGDVELLPGSGKGNKSPVNFKVQR